MCSHNTQTCNVAVLYPVSRIFLHFGKNIANDFRVGRRFCSSNDCHKGQLRPCQSMVEVVLEEVILGKVGEVTLLNRRQQRDM